VQLYAESNQHAVDLHVQAFQLAERLSLPVMVCMDGYVLTHAVEQIDVPEQSDVDSFLPVFAPRQELDPANPMTIGAMVGPEAFTEVKYLMHAKQMEALDEIPAVAASFAEAFGRDPGALVQPYRTDDADIVVVALGSVLGTVRATVDAMRDEGVAIGALGITCFRPWPADEVRDALAHAREVIVVERAFAVGAGGIVGQNTRLALAHLPITLYDVVAGLGGRPVTRASLRSVFADVVQHRLTPNRLHFLDLHEDVVQHELERSRAGSPGPHAESIVRALGAPGSSPH
jgi:pyruvate ferredoxin oxidoreductase alpha subunit